MLVHWHYGNSIRDVSRYRKLTFLVISHSWNPRDTNVNTVYEKTLHTKNKQTNKKPQAIKIEMS